MKFVVLLTALPFLCIPVRGSPLRAPAPSTVALLRSTGADETPGAVGLDETALRFTPEAYLTPHAGFAPLPEPDAETETVIVNSFRSANSFGPQLDPEPDAVAFSRIVLNLLHFSALLSTFDAPDFLFLIAGLTCSAMAFFRRLNPRLEKKMTEILRQTDQPRRGRVRIQQRKMAS